MFKIISRAETLTATFKSVERDIIFSPAEISYKTQESSFGGKNINAARMYQTLQTAGIRVPEFRAVNALSFHRLLDETTVEGDTLIRLVTESDFAAKREDLHEEEGYTRKIARGYTEAYLLEKRSDSGRVILRDFINFMLDKFEESQFTVDEIMFKSILIQTAIMSVSDQIPVDIRASIEQGYHSICQKLGKPDAMVAVRSSAAGEDSDDASFAGLQDTFLFIKGADNVVQAWLSDCASAYNFRSLDYRKQKVDMASAQLEKAISEAVKDPANPEKALAIAKLQEAYEAAKVKFAVQHTSLSVCIMQMVNSERSGTAFSAHNATGFRDEVVIESNFKAGETVVGGMVTPDSFAYHKKSGALLRSMGVKDKWCVIDPEGGSKIVNAPADMVYKWSLSEEEAKEIARGVIAIEAEYGKIMDCEFAIENDPDGHPVLYFVQTRPETNFNLKFAISPTVIEMKRRDVDPKAAKEAKLLLSGDPASAGSASGVVRFLNSAHELSKLKSGDILVMDRTDPDAVPGMRMAGAIIANSGGRTSHAAIVSRELEKPAVIGVNNIEALRALDGQVVTVDGSTGRIYAGELRLVTVGENLDVATVPKTETRVGLILADTDQALKLSRLRHNDFEVGLLRAEFVLANVGAHPRVLLDVDNGTLKAKIDAHIAQHCLCADNAEQAKEIDYLKSLPTKMAALITSKGYSSGKALYCEVLSQAVAQFGWAFGDKDVIYRFTDFKSNEYKNLPGGLLYEPEEDNPMIGERGTGRFIGSATDTDNLENFLWEIEAIKMARDKYKAANIQVMFPFVRTLDQLDEALGVINVNGLQNGMNGLKVFCMTEIPSNGILPLDFLKRDLYGFSIGSNDMTQGVLMTDRDNASLQKTYDELDPALVKVFLSIILAGQKLGKKVGWCGQGVSNSEFLAGMCAIARIPSASVVPDSYLRTKRMLAKLEAQELTLADLGKWMHNWMAKDLHKKLGASLGADSALSVALETIDTTGALAQIRGGISDIQSAFGVQDLNAVGMEVIDLASIHQVLMNEALGKIKTGLGALTSDLWTKLSLTSGLERRDIMGLIKKLNESSLKPLEYASRDWDTVVVGALQTAGFENYADYEANRISVH